LTYQSEDKKRYDREQNDPNNCQAGDYSSTQTLPAGRRSGDSQRFIDYILLYALAESAPRQSQTLTSEDGLQEWRVERTCPDAGPRTGDSKRTLKHVDRRGQIL
jgi:hypothetical protein